MAPKFQIALEALRDRIYTQRRKGNLLLPGERELMLEFDICRSTLRKVLKQLEDEKLIYREKRATKIFSPSRQKYRYAYVVSGHSFSQSFWYQTYYNNWIVLQRQSKSRQVDIELLLLDPEEHSAEEIKQAVSSYDLLFVTTMPTHLFEIVQSAAKEIVLLDPLLPAEKKPIISIDNVKIGQLAAQALKDSGSKKVAVIYNKSIRPVNLGTHQQIRAQAFIKEIKKSKIQVEEFGYPASFWRYVEVMHHYVSMLPMRGFDGLFITSDEKIELIVCDLLEQKLCPEKINIFACDTEGETGKCFIPISAVTTDTVRLAEELLKIIQNFEQKQDISDYTPILLPPLFQRGKTMRKI
ncbi:MAG: GntR family transcriptional regulator [Lentisphaeria bacterium]|nr:GntR family transcriptional regulator [Lentisphaeria bacterium]